MIAFNVIDHKKEVAFDFQNKPMKFVDYETGAEVKVRPGEIQKKYREKMEAFLQLLELKALQIGVDIMAADINKDYNEVLRAFLLRRNKIK